MLLLAGIGLGCMLPLPSPGVDATGWRCCDIFFLCGTNHRLSHHVTCIVRHRACQLSTPCNSRYLSYAIRSLQLRRGSRVTSPVSHSMSNKIEFPLNEWSNMESTHHSLSG